MESQRAYMAFLSFGMVEKSIILIRTYGDKKFAERIMPRAIANTHDGRFFDRAAPVFLSRCITCPDRSRECLQREALVLRLLT